MQLRRIDADFTICKVRDASEIDLDQEFCFVAKTNEELSLVCETRFVPSNTAERDDGWKAFCVDSVLDFSLIGILAQISGALAENGIGLFAVSTYNTDYILVKVEDFDRAIEVVSGSDVKGG